MEKGDHGEGSVERVERRSMRGMEAYKVFGGVTSRFGEGDGWHKQ